MSQYAAKLKMAVKGNPKSPRPHHTTKMLSRQMYLWYHKCVQSSRKWQRNTRQPVCDSTNMSVKCVKNTWMFWHRANTSRNWIFVAGTIPCYVWWKANTAFHHKTLTRGGSGISVCRCRAASRPIGPSAASWFCPARENPAESHQA